MCGITGIHSIADDRPIARPILEAMNAEIVHRGPDDDGFLFDDGRVGLAMRRLSIIDIAGGEQPIGNEDGTVHVVFNGEIYNFRELRKELEGLGHVFRTRSDTEVIVHAYEEYGEAFVEHLRGMFGLAIWDAPRRKLVVARDRVGIKQIYYTEVDGQLVFGSEIKCVLRHPKVRRALSPSAVNHFLTFLDVPAPLTSFDGIHQLEPGHLLVSEDGHVRVKAYWSLGYAPHEGRSEDDWAEALREQLDEAVRVRLVADVPLGAFLSGGLDSGSLVGLMAAHSDEKVKTFSIGYEGEGDSFDERPFARMVAERYATEHREFVVKPDLISILPSLVRAFDQPFADSSAIPNWYLAELTRKHVTVALSGLGADELFAGYERHRGALLAERYRRIPRWLRRGLIAPLVERLPDLGHSANLSGRAKRFVRTADLDFDDRYLGLISAFGLPERAALLTPDFKREIDLAEPSARYHRILASVRDAHPLQRALYADLKLYLPDDLLTLADRMSMAHSLEVRVPFVDHRLLEFVATLPAELNLKGYERKYMMKRAVRDLLPEALLDRRKMGFSVPLTVWFRKALRPFVEETLSEETIRGAGIFDYRAVRRVLDDHFAARANHDNHIWALLGFTVWHRSYLGGGAGATAADAPIEA